ncbi:HNH endonuclease [Caminicella sporogenes]|uniref:HNH endonuclease n=1 Tax=Caminicella sporogenes TaxID=166485 RepID=UPI0025415D87|nr:HNH endonuclease signature motif containing protein [Caminicella sporogenes]WIF94304.1 HNH endonuclease signature motif containing protein [Caminicella sporogenes]
MALKKLCNRCQKNIIDMSQKYCSECEKIVEDERKERYKRYNQSRTDVKEQKFYQSKEWKHVREIVKSRDKGLCLLCLSEKKINYCDTVHHIEELKVNWNKRLDLDNLICLCESCHQYVHRQYSISEKEKKEMQGKLKKLIG